jgi:hypothetical protein
MTNVNATVTQMAPVGGAALSGYKLGWLDVTNKVAQNDTITIKNASTIKVAFLELDTTGAAEANTLSTNVITCTSSTTGASIIKGLIIYKD